MTKADLEAKVSALESENAKYKNMGSPEWIQERIEMGERAKAEIDLIRKIVVR